MRLGIDIGTHSARAAILDATGKPQLVRFDDGSTALPALARQTMHGLDVGAAAAQALVGNTETTVRGCTRLIGRASNLPQHVRAQLPYDVRDVDGEVVCNLLYAEVRASDVYGELVAALVAAAQTQFGTPVEGVVMTVPASAEDRFRVQARAAVEARGIHVLRLINQPTAALLATTFNARAISDIPRQYARGNQPQRVAVVYCGGSTDVSIAEHSPQQTRILATAGDPLLGGDEFAWAVAEQLNQRFRRTANADVFAADDSRAAAFGLCARAEDALHTLSYAPETTLVLDHGAGFGRDLVAVMHRHEVNAWLAPLMARITALCQRALVTAGIGVHQLDGVVLVGEWAHLPILRETIAQAFAMPVGALHTTDAALLPVYGAALATANTGSVWDVTPYPLGINCYYGERELFSPIIKANTPIPTPSVGVAGAHTEQYTTRYPDQTSVTLDILQYRGANAADPYSTNAVPPEACEKLGTWTFSGLKPKRGKTANFSVTFTVDADGILQLRAEEHATGHHLAACVDRGVG